MFDKIGVGLAILYIFSSAVHYVEPRNIRTVPKSDDGAKCGYSVSFSSFKGMESTCIHTYALA